MSVAGTRWTHDVLRRTPRPNAGGLSHRARAVLLVLAGDANAVTGEATTAAVTIGEITGHSERNVRHALEELAAWGLPRRRRPGRTDVWVFPPGAVRAEPRSPATGVAVLLDVVNLSTPRSRATGVELSTPRSPATGTPVAGDRRRVRRDVITDTRRDLARDVPASADDLDDDWLVDDAATQAVREAFVRARVVGS